MLCLATGALLRVLKQNPGQDIRNLLKGSAQLTEGLIQDFDLNPGLFLESFFPVRMLKGIRYNAISALSEAAKVERFARRQALLANAWSLCLSCRRARHERVSCCLMAKWCA